MKHDKKKPITGQDMHHSRNNGGARVAAPSNATPSKSVHLWATLSRNAKSTWKGLTEEDLSNLDASPDKLYGLIAERFGETPEAVKAKLDAFSR